MRGFAPVQHVRYRHTKKGSGFVLQTEHGDTFYTSRLVNAAGPWSSDISRMVGIDLPVARAFQQIFVTDPLPGISKAFPVAIYPDLGIGFHEEGGGILTQYNRPYEPNLSDRIRTDYNWFLAHAQRQLNGFHSCTRQAFVPNGADIMMRRRTAGQSLAAQKICIRSAALTGMDLCTALRQASCSVKKF